MRCIIFANGEIDNYQRAKTMIKPDDYIICADGGLRHVVEMGLIPNVLVGDLDSVEEKHVALLIEKNVEILKFPKEKDDTDTEIAIAYGIKQNPSSMLLMGVTGGRLDHTLANIGLLKELYDKGIKACIHSDYNEIYITKDELTLKGQKGDLLSVLPISEHVKAVTLKGLQYPLTDRDLHFGAPIGISNVFLGETATVTVKEGYLLVMKARD